MARKKTTSKRRKSIRYKPNISPLVTKIAPEKITVKKLKQNLFEQLKLGESYVSLILGAIVVLVLFLGFFVFFKGNSAKNPPTNVPVINSPTATPTQKTYILGENESLWDVAVKFYGDGYRWPDIAKANNLEETADFVHPGTKLIIPNVK